MSHDNVEDLIALARRHELSEPEVRRLQMVLKTSESARALHEVGASFDKAPTTRPGDDELLTRVTARMKQGLAAKPTFDGRKRPQRWLIGTLALLATAAAAAAASVVGVALLAPGEHPSQALTPGPGSAGEEQPSTPTAAPTTAHNGPSEHARSNVPAKVRVEQVTGSAPVEPASSSATRRSGQRLASAQTAQGVFKAGNAARKSGKPDSALATYRQLQQAFPKSAEARLSYVLSGQLLLAMGKAQAALPQFDTYLRSGAPGGLAEEALWGKAQALSRLGRAGEERQVWRTLLQRFPKSVYAATARQRLER
jgi:TolA-binding protein